VGAAVQVVIGLALALAAGRLRVNATHVQSPFLPLLASGTLTATFVPDKLNEIVQRRHRVAHTGAALDITRSQLNESLKFLPILSTWLDAQLRSHVDGCYPPT